MRPDLHRRLTLRQQRFAYEYIRTGNPKESAINAGYSKNCASEIAYDTLRLPHVEEFIKRSMKEAATKLGITPEYLLGKLKTGLERVMPESKEIKEFVEKNPIEGKSVEQQYRDEYLTLTDTKSAVAVISEINRMMGNYAPEKSERTSKIDGLDKLINICDEQVNK